MKQYHRNSRKGERERAEAVLETIIAENFPDLGGKKQALKSKRYREIPSDVT